MITGLIQSSRESYHVNKPLLQGTAGKGEREDGLKEGTERRGDVADLFALPLSPFLILKASGKLSEEALFAHAQKASELYLTKICGKSR